MTAIGGVISLYTGAGGIELGAESAGLDVRVCVEIDPVRVQTLSLNRPNWRVVGHDISALTSLSILKCSGLRKSERFFLSAGSPCQPYSKSAFWVPGRLSKIKSDHRTRTLWHFVRVVRDLRPQAFFFENVQALSYEPSLSLFNRFLRSLSKLGYGVNWRVINSVRFGVPQKRERLFVVGIRNHQMFDFPEPTHRPNQYVSAGEALRSLRGSHEEGEDVTGKWGHLLCKIPPGKNYLHLARTKGGRRAVFAWRSRYWSFLLKLSPKLPSWTIQASPGPYAGPFHWENRRLRIPEVKRLQTFPDKYVVVGGRNSAWAQLGDATPPLLSARLFASLLKQTA